MRLEIVEYTDPLCPWAWGSEPTFRRLRHLLGPDVCWRRVFGVLFDDDDDPAPDPDAETRWYHRHLADIAGHTGAPYPAMLERVARTSRPASRAVIAAGEQGADVATGVLRRIREQMFLTGRPPDTADRVRACVTGVPALDVDRLVADAASEPVADRLASDWAETRRPVAALDVVDADGPHPGRAKETPTGRRYAFPTLLVRNGDDTTVVAGWRPLYAYLAATRADPAGDVETVDAALSRYRSLTRPDLRILCGSDRIPADGVRIDTPGGPLWLHNDDVATHPAVPANKTYSDGN